MRQDTAEILSIYICLTLWALYALNSYPMMYPGLDIWSHLVHMNFEDSRNEPWRIFWTLIFKTLDIKNYFDQAILIHRVQTLIAGICIFFSARWILLLIFCQWKISDKEINIAALFSLSIWTIMHGTVSTPIFSNKIIWQSWIQWYSVNYQIALPLYFLSVSAIFFGILSPKNENNKRNRYVYLSIAGASAILVSLIHAAELPYLIISAVIIGTVCFQWKLKWNYAAAITVSCLLIFAGMHVSYTSPEGLQQLRNFGWRGVASAIESNGELMLRGLNRGGASWNYLYWMTLLCITLSTIFAILIKSNNKKYKIQRVDIRVLSFIALSAIPAGMLHFKITSGILSMITYPQLAWRFTFSSFLYISPAIFAILITSKIKENSKLLYQIATMIFLIGATLKISSIFEPHQVSLRYTKSILKSLNQHEMRYGISPSEQLWLDAFYNKLITANPTTPVCTDMFTAYYLFFKKRYSNVILPDKIGKTINPERSEAGCKFPTDGGELISDYNLAKTPWNF